MIYDLTPAVSARLQVWPGDTPPSREVLLDMKRGDNLTLSTLHATVHLGATARVCPQERRTKHSRGSKDQVRLPS